MDEELVTVVNWIPCCKKKPIKNGYYLCTLKSPVGDDILLKVIYWLNGLWCGYNMKEILAWAPQIIPFDEVNV